MRGNVTIPTFAYCTQGGTDYYGLWTIGHPGQTDNFCYPGTQSLSNDDLDLQRLMMEISVVALRLGQMRMVSVTYCFSGMHSGRLTK